MKDRNAYFLEKRKGKKLVTTIFRERRRLGLSAPDNYGGVKEQQFGYNV
jgi:hypothetical protein